MKHVSTCIFKALTIVAVGAACATSVPAADAASAPNTQSANGLKLMLSSAKEKYGTNEQVRLRSTFENVGNSTFSLTFWWNRHLRITDSQGQIVPPEKGPKLPTGMAERPTELAPGKTFSRAEPLACTQPSGAKEEIGWSYKLKPGTYRIALLFEVPPSHGDSSAPRVRNEPPRTWWTGKVISNEVTVVIE